jgi:hypothetical protein
MGELVVLFNWLSAIKITTILLILYHFYPHETVDFLSIIHVIHSINQGDLNLTSSSDFFTTRNTGIKLFRGKNVQRYYLIDDVDEYVVEGFKSDKVNFNRKNKFLVCQEITGTLGYLN